MSNPKQSFLSTLGKHMVVGSTLLPSIEPKPPVGDDEGKTAAEKEAADKLAAEKKAAADAAAATPNATDADKEKAEAERLAAEKKAADDKAAAAVPADATPPEKPKKKESKPLPPVDKDDLATEAAPAPADEPKAVATLLDYAPTRAEVRYLEVLQSGAEREPEKYQSIFDREVDRLKKVNQFAAKWREENPGEELTADVPEYRKFLRANPPAIDAGEHEDLKEELIAERTKKKVRAEMEEEMAPKLRRVIELEVKPEITRAEEAVEQAVLAALPEALEKDDHLLAAAKEGASALSKVPEEGKIFKTAIARGQQVTSEFLRLRRGLVPFDARNETHVFISRSVATAAETFEAQGGAERIRDGRRFVSPAVYSKLKPEAKAKHWTFADSDILETFVTMTALGAVQELTERRKEREALDSFRKPKVPAGEKKAAPAAEPPKSSPAVQPKPTSPPGTPTPPKNERLKQMMGILPAKNGS